MTSAALSTTGAFKQASDYIIVDIVSSGSALPVSFNEESPACNFVISNFKSSLSLMVFKIDIAELESSGPIPSPVINEILYIIKNSVNGNFK